MKITVLPVYSRLAPEASVRRAGLWEQLPVNRDGTRWGLSQHQLDTYQELTGGNCEVIFNTAMTGDGKSLAGQLRTLVHGFEAPLLAMYPTNELIQDQKGQLDKSIRSWNSRLAEPGLLYSAGLDAILAEGDYRQRGEALLGLLRNRDMVLTNPDIFHLLVQQFYLRPDDAPDKLIGPLAQRYGQFTFDEFHIFDAPQVISVLNALLFIEAISSPARPHRYLFLSATPGELMLEYLSRSGLKVREIQGQYLHTETAPDPLVWRMILQKADVYFDTGPNLEAWIEQHGEDILLQFFLDHKPGAKGAIIVNSVASAYRLLDRLRPLFERHGLTVEPNTGLTSRSRRKASYAADLLIGTSTVDVGVDFQINFLLFESRDAGSFLQRLGRMGRHTGFERDGRFHRFEKFVAYAIVPKWVEEALFTRRESVPPQIKEDDLIDRERLNAAIRSAFPPTATFDAYARLWGKFQSVRILTGLNHKTIREQHANTREGLHQRYESTFGIRLTPAYREFKELWEERRPLLNEAISFRGGSYFACGLIDETESGPEQFKTADLFQLAANARLEALTEEEFYASVEKNGLTRRLFERQEPLAFFRFFGYRQEPQDYELWLDRDLQDWGAESFGRARVLKGFKLLGDLPGRSELNNRLSRRGLPALLCAGFHPLDLKRRLRLPLLFPLYGFTSRDGVAGCAAFGRQALLLDARLYYSRIQTGGDSVIV